MSPEDNHDASAAERLVNGAAAPPGPPPLHLARHGGLWLVGVLSRAEDGTVLLGPVWELERSVRVDERLRKLLVKTECHPVAGLASIRVVPLRNEPDLLLPLDVLAVGEVTDILAAIAKCENVVRSMLASAGRVEPGGPSRIILPSA